MTPIPDEIILIVLGMAALFVALAITLVIAVAIMNPTWFSRSCSTSMGMFAGMGAAAGVLMLFCVACLCAVVGMVAIVVAGR